jgi:histidine ammonia-lyase
MMWSASLRAKALRDSFQSGTNRKQVPLAATIKLDGRTVTPAVMWEAACTALDPAKCLRVEYPPEAVASIKAASDLLDKLVAAAEPVYGINTGFGHFADVVIPPEKLIELQYNIVRSHCSGVGELLSRDLVLAMWLIKLNTICRGNSGVRLSTMRSIARVLETGILGCVPSQGSVGASGDLAPASHAVQTVIGEGRCTMPHEGKFVELPAEEALKRAGLGTVRLGPKEGLSLVNGTPLTTAMAVKAWYEGDHLLQVANCAAAMSIEALGGSRTPFSDEVLKAHGHPGTLAAGREIGGWLGNNGSELSDLHAGRHWVQDPYSLRCAPQVHGAIWEEFRASEVVLECEMNSAADNPLLFPEEMSVACCGNFHAIYPARVCDRIASALTTLGSISERRISQSMRAPRGHLPTFLIRDGGLNSGLMMAQVSAAALVSESKSLSFPASVDSIPTNLLQEDHVSMGPIAGMKALQIVANVRRVLAIELITAAQAISLLHPKSPAPRIGEVYKRIREFVSPLERDRQLTDDIELIAEMIRNRTLLPS